MADHLARIFGTEEDKVNCPFYYKIGACRHGERCSRNHMKPNFSQTLIIPHMYTAPPLGPDGQPIDDTERFEDFYEEIMEELNKYGYIEQLHVVENLGEHMFGNIYVKYSSEEEAEAAMKALHGRYYAGRMLMPEYSPVTDFREARCRQFDEDHCGRGGYCNFMHLKAPSRDLKKLLKKLNKKWKKKSASRSRSRDRDRKRHRSKSRSRSRGRDRGDRDRERRRSRSRSRSRSRGRDRDRDRSGGKKEDFPRGSSAERRAKIAQWKKDKDAAAGSAPPADGGAPPAFPPSN